MKNLILKFLYLFYKYYDKGSTKSIAYISALTALMMVLFLNIFSILILTGIGKVYFVFLEGTPISIKYLLVFVIFFPIFILIKKIFKMEDMLKVEMDKITMRKGYFIIVAYIFLSILMLTLIIQNN